MSMTKQIPTSLFLFSSLILLLVIIPSNTYADCPPDVTDPIEFGSWSITNTTSQFSLNVTNTGSQRGTLFMVGDVWKNSTGDTIMKKSTTHWSLTAGENYDDMKKVLPNNDNMVDILKKKTVEIFFKVLIDYIPSVQNFEGNVTQSLTFSLQCN